MEAFLTVTWWLGVVVRREGELLFWGAKIAMFTQIRVNG